MSAWRAATSNWAFKLVLLAVWAEAGMGVNSVNPSNVASRQVLKAGGTDNSFEQSSAGLLAQN